MTIPLTSVIHFVLYLLYDIKACIKKVTHILSLTVKRTQNDFRNRGGINCNKTYVYLSGWKWRLLLQSPSRGSYHSGTL